MADVITRLKVESSDYDNKLKRAISELGRMSSEAQKAGNKLNVADKDNVAFARSLGNMQTVARTAKGRISELTNSFTEASLIYKRLTNEEKASPFGKALSQSIDQLKGRLETAKKELADVNNELNGMGKGKGFDMSSLFGGKFDMSSLMNVGPMSNLSSAASGLGLNIDALGASFTAATGLSMGMAAAIVAVTAAVAEGTKKLIEYNAELEKKNQLVSVTTGMSGGQGDEMRNGIDGLVKAYNVDFRDALNAANTLMTQFGLSGEEALSVVKDGLRGMVTDDAPKMLQMIQQYGPAFKDMGISASELAAIIQNTEGGIFTDDGMRAIQMGGKKIREMSDTTKASLQAIGIDADEMSQKLSDGSLTTLEALQEVATQMSQFGTQSKEVGAVLTDVFGRSGAQAGTQLVQSIATLNTNLEETKLQTGDLGSINDQLANAYTNLDTAVSAFFGDTESGLGTIIERTEIDFINALAEVMDDLEGFKPIWDEIKTIGMDCWEGVSDTLLTLIGSIGDILSIIGDVINIFNTTGNEGKKDFDLVKAAITAITAPLKLVREALDWLAILVRNLRLKFDELKSNFTSSFKMPWLDKAINNLADMVGWIKDAISYYKQLKATMGGGDGDKAIGGALGGAGIGALGGAGVGALGGRKFPAHVTPHISTGGGGSHSGGGHSGGGGSTTETYAAGSVGDIEKQISELQKKLKNATDNETYNAIQKQIDDLKALESKITNNIADESIKGLQQKMQEQSKIINETTDASARKSAQTLYDEYAKQIKLLQTLAKGGYGVNDGDKGYDSSISSGISNGISSSLNSKKGQKIQLTMPEDESFSKIVDSIKDTTSEITGGLSNIGSGLKSLGLDLGDGFDAALNAINGIMSIVSGVQTIISAIQAITTTRDSVYQGAVTGLLSGIAASSAVTAAASVTKAIPILGMFAARGGVVHAASGFVPGTMTSGDKVPAMLNSGELVLNKAQQGNLASQLSGGGLLSNLHLETSIREDKLVVMLNNGLRKRGKGTLLTSR